MIGPESGAAPPIGISLVGSGTSVLGFGMPIRDGCALCWSISYAFNNLWWTPQQCVG
jgi:hypothetical protein